MEKINEEIIIDNWFRKIISKDFIDKKWNKSNFLVASHSKVNEAVVILALDEEENILYLEEFRYWPEEKIINFPMWWIEQWDSKIDTLKKELKEETWYSSENIEFLFEWIVSNYEDTKIFYYIAKNCKKWKQNLEDTEFIDLNKTSISNFEKMILEWKVKCPLTISCFYFAKWKWLV